MRGYDLVLEKEPLTYDDTVLIQLINEYREDINKRKNNLDRKISINDKYDHLSLTVARLAYEFAREEYDVLFNEAVKRRLV